MIINTDDYISVKEAADILGVAPSTVQYRALIGKLVIVKVGTTSLVLKTSIAPEATV